MGGFIIGSIAFILVTSLIFGPIVGGIAFLALSLFTVVVISQ